MQHPLLEAIPPTQINSTIQIPKTCPLENLNRKELVNTENYTIEHTLPQNPNTPIEGQQKWGENGEEKYLHTIGSISTMR